MLLVDAGNTRISLAETTGDGRLLRLPSLDWRRDEQPPSAEAAVLLATSAEAGAWFRARFSGRTTTAAPPDCGQHAGCGPDRVLGGWMAVRQLQCRLILVDAGTAVCVDAWCPDPDRASGAAFLGGFIAPGALTWFTGLAQRAPALPVPLREQWQHSSDLRSTEGGLCAAWRHGWPAAMQALVEELQRRHTIDVVLLTGGDAALLQGLGWSIRPDVVLQGLAALAAPA